MAGNGGGGKRTPPEAKATAIRLDFSGEEVSVRVQYTAGENAPNPGTKRRKAEVLALARQGLTEALEALAQGDAAMVGEAGFTQRVDTLNVSPASMRGGG